MRTQVAIVGAGPAGLTLGHLLHRHGIESIVLEARTREYVERRVRAGVLEAGTADLFCAIGVGERMRREGLIHRGIALRFSNASHRIGLDELTGGKTVTVYGQQEIVKDLIAARLAGGLPLLFESAVFAVGGLDRDRATLRYRTPQGAESVIEADYVVGCDGFHGPCRNAIPATVLRVYERVFPFSWMGILAASPPVSEELIYTNHENGFALVSMRSPTVTRLYLQCSNTESLDAWPDQRFWSELRVRLGSAAGGPSVLEGTVLQRGITPMRSFVAEPMRYGRLFLAGDAAHIVPPTGAKGMNLAIADVRVLAEAFADSYHAHDAHRLDAYSQTCLRRIWKTQRFSAWMTTLLHRFEAHSEFDRRLQLAELDYVTSSRAASQTLAENYVGLALT